jgi:hypothetical protein
MAVLAAAGCGAPLSGAITTTLNPIGPLCAAGFAPAGALCEPVLPPAPCGVNERPTIGSSTCVAVGWSTCPAGFVRAASGWGCDAAVPPQPCTGNTMEKIGASGCQPIGDCSAAFPPAAATLFVDDGFTAAQLDATHFNTISGALAAAPAGATIAVAAGHYVDALAPAKAVTIAGVCAEQVVIDGSTLTAPGISVPHPIDVTLSGVTLSGHNYAIAATAKAQLTVRDVLVIHARTAGVFAGSGGTRIELDDSVVRDSVGVPVDTGGFGAEIDNGAALVLNGTVLAGNAIVGVNTKGTGSTVTLTGSIIRATVPQSNGELGIGIHAENGATVTLSGSLLADNHDFALDLRTASATLTETVIRGTRSRPTGESGVGVSLLGGGILSLTRVGLSDNRSFGLSVEDAASVAAIADSVVELTLGAGLPGTTGLHLVDGQLTVTDTAVVNNESAALAAFVAPAHVQISGSLFQDTRPPTHDTTADAPFGRGVDAEDGACLDLSDSAIVGSTGIALFLQTTPAANACDAHVDRLVVLGSHDQANGEATRAVSVQGGKLALSNSAIISQLEAGVFLSGTAVATVTGTLLRALPDATAPLSDLVVAHDTDEVRLTDSYVDGSPGIGLALGGARGSFWRGAVTNNALALSVFRGTMLQLTDMDPDDGPLMPQTFLVDTATQFVGNQSMLGTADLLLPDPFPGGTQ